MPTPPFRHRPVFFNSSSSNPAAVSDLVGVPLLCLLVAGMGACHSSDVPQPRQDSSVREAGSVDGRAPGSDLLISDGGQETQPAQDGKSTDGADSGDLAAQGPLDAVSDTGTGSNPDALFDSAEASLDTRALPNGDAEQDSPADAPEQDSASVDLATGTEPPAVDGGPGTTDLGSEDLPIRRDSNLVDTVDSVAPVGLDLAPEAADSSDGPTDTIDAPNGNPDSTPEVGPDGRDTSIGGPDAPDGNPAIDTRVVLDGQDSKGIDGAAIDGGGPCCGCLCRDPSWSCSRDTCLDPAGHALTLAAEAGFFELAAGSYVSETEARVSPTNRIWYAFQPAATSPESKPLAVFFNGGPGASTMAYLFSLNTAPYTLDPAFTGTAKIASNTSSWAQFANLLYIDAPATGFSYPLALADGSKPSVGIDLDRDAGAFLRVVVRFLARHPRLQANRIVIVGESYGGTRSTLMLYHVLNYQSLAGTTAAYRDPDLYNDLVAHFTAVWPQDNPRALSADKIATQFGWQVLIQPVVAGDAQWNLQNPDRSVCLTTSYDGYQCNQASGWSDQLLATTGQNLTTIPVLRQALGVDPTTIDWLYASARRTAYGRTSGTITSTPELTTTFGALASDDNYFVVLNTSATGPFSSSARNWHDSAIGLNFLSDLVYVDTFITNAKYDMVVWTPAIAPGLASFTSTVASAVIDTAPRMGITRLGWITVTYQPGVIPAPATREIRLPSYSSAGHTVSIRDPANLLADVMQWYSSSLTGASVWSPEAVATSTPLVPFAARRLPGSETVPANQVLYIGP
jgi:hypothetical protein